MSRRSCKTSPLRAETGGSVTPLESLVCHLLGSSWKTTHFLNHQPCLQKSGQTVTDNIRTMFESLLQKESRLLQFASVFIYLITMVSAKHPDWIKWKIQAASSSRATTTLFQLRKPDSLFQPSDVNPWGLRKFPQGQQCQKRLQCFCPKSLQKILTLLSCFIDVFFPSISDQEGLDKFFALLPELLCQLFIISLLGPGNTGPSKTNPTKISWQNIFTFSGFY